MSLSVTVTAFGLVLPTSFLLFGPLSPRSYNAFCFALSKAAARFLVEAYGTLSAASPAVPLYATHGFDWSTHILEPLAAQTSELWMQRHSGAQVSGREGKGDERVGGGVRAGNGREG